MSLFVSDLNVVAILFYPFIVSSKILLEYPFYNQS